jgi:hypothetical protein
MNDIAFTGPAKDLDGREERLIEETIIGLRSPDSFVSGGARGVDVFSAKCAVRHFFDALHFVYIPMFRTAANAPPQPCRRDEAGLRELSSLAAEYGARLEYRWCRPGQPKESDGLLLRDDLMVGGCTHLVASL